MKRSKIIQILAVLLFPIICHAWEGTDYSSGKSIEIEKGNLVRNGSTVDYFDSENGYSTGTVESISRYGSSVELEVTDDETGETHSFDME